jgi:hypothetical protein
MVIGRSPTLPLRPRVRARTREGASSASKWTGTGVPRNAGASSASKWTGTGVPRNAGFLPMILPINRSLVGARVERFSSARRKLVPQRTRSGPLRRGVKPARAVPGCASTLPHHGNRVVGQHGVGVTQMIGAVASCMPRLSSGHGSYRASVVLPPRCLPGTCVE